MVQIIINQKNKKIKRKEQGNFSCFKALTALQFLWITKGFNKLLAKAGITKREQGISPKELALATMVQPLVGSKSEKETAQRSNHNTSSSGALQRQINRFHNNSKNGYDNLLPTAVQSCFATRPSDIMVIDDSPVEKSGKKMAWAKKLFNSAKKYYYHGYELVALALVAGRTALPINFAPRKAKGKKPKKTKKSRTKHSLMRSRKRGGKGKVKAARQSQTKLKLALQLIVDALQRGVKARYVIFDSWYCAVWFLRNLDALGLFWVTVVRSNRLFIYQGRKIKAQSFVKLALRGGCCPMKFIAELPKYGLVAVVVNFRRGKYEVLVTNDVALSAETVVRIYKKRWKIEVLFREAKQHYGLEKFHNRKWWAIIAHLAFSLLAQFLVRFFAIFLKNQNYEIIKQTLQQTFIRIEKELKIPLGKWEFGFSEFLNYFKISKELQICLLSV